MKKLFTIAFFMIAFIVSGQCQAVKKKVSAARFDDKINIDGKLDEAIWKTGEIATGFTQTDPVPGDAPTQKSEVRVFYNDEGIYVGAMLYDTNPEGILKELSQRDDRGNTDWFGVAFDTYQDGLNGFAFIVTASGVQQDLKFSGGGEDGNWDGIWVSEVEFLDNGWSVEMYIPYLSLRFPNVDEQKWNVQFTREIRRNRETVTWNPVDPAINGFINQAGQLEGIQNIKSPVRLSITPFITGYVNTISNPRIGQDIEASTAYTGGMDLKYGINDAFTLDMTLVPDFGQVISDNQVLNLSPFEVFFEENRQFFTEGIELFDKGNLFYTRRVGGRPFGFSRAQSERGLEEAIESNPDVVQLYNATKVSGRLASGTGLGIFNAVAGEEYATLRNVLDGTTRRIQTNPLTNYNVLVADQNLPNNSVISIINTNVQRRGTDYDANTTGAFFNFKNKSQQYGVWGNAALTNKFFEAGPDTGFKYELGLGKIGGKWRYSGYMNVESDDYDPNDLGILFSPNERSFGADFEYNEYRPKNQKIQRWEIGVRPFYSRLYSPNVFTDFGVNFNGFVLWKSRNALGFNARIEPVETYDYFEPRTPNFSRFYTYPTNYRGGGFFSSDYRKTLALDVNFNYRKFNQEGRSSIDFGFSPRVRVNDKLSFFTTIGYAKNLNDEGFANRAFIFEEVPELEDGDILFGRRDVEIMENSLSTQYIFNNKMFLTARIRHYWAQVEYNQFNILDAAGYLQPLNYDGQSSDGVALFDNNVNFFNIDLNYTWRFAKGSDIIFVWKQSISDFNKDVNSSYFSNLNGVFDAFQQNSVSLKIVYFLDYGSVF